MRGQAQGVTLRLPPGVLSIESDYGTLFCEELALSNLLKPLLDTFLK